MANKSKKTEAERNLAHITGEKQRLVTVKQEILDRLAEAENTVDVEAAEETRLHEESLRAGRPGQPSKKLKAAEEGVDLVVGPATVAREGLVVPKRGGSADPG